MSPETAWQRSDWCALGVAYLCCRQHAPPECLKAALPRLQYAPRSRTVCSATDTDHCPHMLPAGRRPTPGHSIAAVLLGAVPGAG